VQPLGCITIRNPKVAREEDAVEITREVVLDAPVEEVWDAVADPDRVDEWFSEDGEERVLVVEEVETGRRVAYTWEEGRVAIELERAGERTRVFVTEVGEPGWNAVFALRALAFARA
jgi:uncharacterized protein YndB with AHSA1/START domain